MYSSVHINCIYCIYCVKRMWFHPKYKKDSTDDTYFIKSSAPITRTLFVLFVWCTAYLVKIVDAKKTVPVSTQVRLIWYRLSLFKRLSSQQQWHFQHRIYSKLFLKEAASFRHQQIEKAQEHSWYPRSLMYLLRASVSSWWSLAFLLWPSSCSASACSARKYD